MKIAEIKELLANNPNEELLAELAEDSRSGVQKLVTAYYKKQQAEQAERERFAKMLMYENNCYNDGAQFVQALMKPGAGRWPGLWL